MMFFSASTCHPGQAAQVAPIRDLVATISRNINKAPDMCCTHSGVTEKDARMYR